MIYLVEQHNDKDIKSCFLINYCDIYSFYMYIFTNFIKIKYIYI